MVVAPLIGFFAIELAGGVKDRTSKALIGPVWNFVDTKLGITAAEPFQKETKSALAAIDAKINKIVEEAGKLATSDVQTQLILQTNWLTDQLVPFLREQAEMTKIDSDLDDRRKEVRTRRESLSGWFVDAQKRLKSRLESCDFPARLLFGMLQDIAALELIYFSWEYFLTESSPAVEQENLGAKLEAIQKLYEKARQTKTEIIEGFIEELCTARLKKCVFTSTIKRKHVSESPGSNYYPSFFDHVKYEYKDSFSSTYSDDPFRGLEIHKHEDVEATRLTVGPHDAKVVDAYMNFRKSSKDHREHVARLEDLNDKHIREPAYEFLDKIKNLPCFLSKAQEERQIESGHLPVGWDQNPGLVLKEPYRNKHPLVAATIEANKNQNKNNKGRRLRKDCALSSGDYLESPSKVYKLIFDNGRLELTLKDRKLWQLDLSRQEPMVFRLMSDGNLVVSDKKGESVWSGNTANKEVDCLELQNDGNLVMYKQGRIPVWSTGTNGRTRNMLVHLNGDVHYEQVIRQNETIEEFLLSANGKYKLYPARGGNLVLFDLTNKTTVWASDTKSQGATELRMQADGNLVLYRTMTAEPIWATNTNGKGSGVRAVLEDWGDLVLYDKDGKNLWSSENSILRPALHKRRLGCW